MQNHQAEIESLRRSCESWLPHQYDRERRDEAQVRLNSELKLVEQHGHSEAIQRAAEIGRFTVQQDISSKLIGAGPCSIISYLLQLSDIDPLRHQLPAERFLSHRTIGFYFIVDPKRESEVRDFAEGRTGFEQTIRIHSATELEMVPHHVARLIQRDCDPEFDVRCLPLVDARTGEFLSEENIAGVFQLESEEVQLQLRKLKPRSVESLAEILTAVQISTARDGFLEEFVEQVARGHDAPRKPFTVSELLRETHGLLLYQEQIMLVLYRLGGIALEDGYEFVKQAAKRKNIGAFRERFLTSAVNSTMSKDEGETLFDELEQAAGYALCKSHQLANAITTWRSAYLKTHFRKEFEQAAERIAVGVSETNG